MIAMIMRNTPETLVPMIPVTLCRDEESFCTWPASEWTPKPSSRHSVNTIVECPRENQNPTETGRWSSAISFRVVLSIAAM